LLERHTVQRVLRRLGNPCAQTLGPRRMQASAQAVNAKGAGRYTLGGGPKGFLIWAPQVHPTRRGRARGGAMPISACGD
jgi:hypothetical protein